MRSLVIWAFLLQTLSGQCLKKSPRCVADQGLGQSQGFYAIQRAEVGSRWTFDCSDAGYACQIANPLCRFTIQWHRFSGCQTSQIVPLGRFHLEGAYKLSVDKVREEDLGLWGCELLSLEGGSSQLISTGIFRIFLLHVLSTPNPFGVLHCARNASVACPLGDICYAHQQRSHLYFVSATQRGCWPLRNIPPSLFSQLISSPSQTCTVNEAATSCPSYEVQTSKAPNKTLVCCFCFSNDCNRREIQLRSPEWSDQSGRNERACAEVENLMTEAKLFQVQKEPPQNPGNEPSNEFLLNKAYVQAYSPYFLLLYLFLMQ